MPDKVPVPARRALDLDAAGRRSRRFSVEMPDKVPVPARRALDLDAAGRRSRRFSVDKPRGAVVIYCKTGGRSRALPSEEGGAPVFWRRMGR